MDLKLKVVVKTKGGRTRGACGVKQYPEEELHPGETDFAQGGRERLSFRDT